MSTLSQVTANRLNAQKSTGPSSAEGKDATRFNALKLGIYAQSAVIPGEDPAEFEALAAAYHHQFQPVGPLEARLVETIIQSDWMERRLNRIETEMLRHLLADESLPADCALGAVYARDAERQNPLYRVFQRRMAAERSYFRAIRELRAIQQQRLAVEEEAVIAAAMAPPPPVSRPAPPAASAPAKEGNWLGSVTAAASVPIVPRL